jgi:hypothetical protein
MVFLFVRSMTTRSVSCGYINCACASACFSMLRERGRTSKMRATSSFSVRGVNSLVQVGPGQLQFFKYGGRVFAVSSTYIS